MGWGPKVPVADERMLKTMEKVGLVEKDLKVLFKRFCKCDKELSFSKSGTIDHEEFYRSFKEEKSPFGDAIFSLIDVDNSGVLDFSEYVEALSAFCLLSRDEVLKFCFFVFDEDKNGTIEGEELNDLLDILHSDSQNSNMKLAMEKFDFNSDGKIDFDEFKLLHSQFPTLLYPAFRMQQNMRTYTLGDKWWHNKMQNLSDIKSEPALKEIALKEKKAKEKKKLQKKAARAKMGFFKYYFCPCQRNRYIVQSEDLDSDSDREEAREEHKEDMLSYNQAKKALKKKPWKKKEATVNVGKRVPLTKEQRMERAKKRRTRDMNDRPSRK